ncbi:putative MFS family arabinose efflux permease [Pseudoduganella flava]|uniref:Uncharacterized MFS-type transporter GO485_21670 n=1 Tax=Pseudoduganella flava TaxID=871742 RepID=A0A562Q3R8_9BURK|nr:arabinose transporter [Pseudoduganella flava]QGZ41411.1 MFS transporter [Pseudoduganella flava]TWI51364.1 putative MFS family arabinose efflux permease [Pseudoduganella flava]
MTSSTTSDRAHMHLVLLAAVLFLSYLCVGMALPVVPVFVTGRLGFGNAWAGLGAGIAFFATIVSRGHAGAVTDLRGGRPAVARGLAYYVAGALTSMCAALPLSSPAVALAILLCGRLLAGLGESLVTVGVVGWGIGLAGPQRSGQVLALIGAAIYGALAVGGPVGLALLDRHGFAAAMGAGALLPCLALLALRAVPHVAPQAGAVRPSFFSVVGRIWGHGAVVCLQGIGFAAIGAFFALHCMDRHWSHAGLGLTAFGGGFVLMRVLGGQLPDRFGGLPVAMASLATEALGQWLIWSAATPGAALAGAFLTGLGCSLVFPAMGREVVRLVAPYLRGTALGAFAAFQDIAYAFTGPLAGLVADRAGYGGVFAIGAAAAMAGLALACALWRVQAGRAAAAAR